MFIQLTTASLLTSALIFGFPPSFDELPATTIVSEVDSSSTPSTTIADAAATTEFVDIVICLDTSGSMDGLINAARQKLWAIINDLALADPTPKLRVALLSYGNDGHASENGWVKVETDFTEDLDKVSQMLFGLTTNGGTELVGRVVQTAAQELDWHPSTDALKIVLVAGNESADQDQQAPFREVCKDTISQGIMINSIYCVYHGDSAEVANEWKDVARLADGQFATIDQNNTAVVIATPYDDALIEKSAALNHTYLWFGEGGAMACDNQWEQDANAATMNKAAAASRAQTKAGYFYSSSWDLVDALRNEQIKLEEIAEEELPETMQTMTLDARIAHVEEMGTERAKIQKEIDELNAKRQKFVTAEQMRQQASGTNQFDLIIRNAIRQQAMSRGFSFEPVDASTTDPGSEAATYLPYFVQLGSEWVHSALIEEFEQSLATSRPMEVADTIDVESDAYQPFVERLDEPTAAALTSIESGAALIKVDDKVYRITMPAVMPDAANVQRTLQQTSNGVPMPRQQMSQQGASQQVITPPPPAPPVQQADQRPSTMEIAKYFETVTNKYLDRTVAHAYWKIREQHRVPVATKVTVDSPQAQKLIETLSKDEQDMIPFLDKNVLIRVDKTWYELVVVIDC